MPNSYFTKFYGPNQHGVPVGIYARCQYGNKKRRKAKMKNGELIFRCGCCRLVDHRREILDRIADDEMSDYAGEG